MSLLKPRTTVEVLLYNPAIKNTGDLEAGTHTVVPTSRPAIGLAQYNASLTLPAPDDSRLSILRIASRLNVNITNLGTATTINCFVRVDIDDADHELFNLSWNSTGSKLAVIDIHSGNLPVLFDLIRDGMAHTYYFLFWSDVANQVHLDLVQLWVGVGTTASAAWGAEILQITHTGFAKLAGYLTRVGTGNFEYSLMCPVGTGADRYRIWSSNAAASFRMMGSGNPVVTGSFSIRLTNLTVATDLAYLQEIGIMLMRSA